MSKQAGKGDKRRPGDSEKFRANYKAIFGNQKKQEATKHPAPHPLTPRPVHGCPVLR